MTQQVITSFVDDLDGSTAVGTVQFALEGKSYEIDLSDENAARLRDSLAPFVSSARRATTGRGRAKMTVGAPARADREQTQAIRAWAKDNGHAISERGRIPKTVVEAFQAAH